MPKIDEYIMLKKIYGSFSIYISNIHTDGASDPAERLAKYFMAP